MIILVSMSCEFVPLAQEGRHDLPIYNIWKTTPKTLINLGITMFEKINKHKKE